MSTTIFFELHSTAVLDYNKILQSQNPVGKNDSSSKTFVFESINYSYCKIINYPVIPSYFLYEKDITHRNIKEKKPTTKRKRKHKFLSTCSHDLPPRARRCFFFALRGGLLDIYCCVGNNMSLTLIVT